MYFLLVLFVSIAPVFLIGCYIYKKDSDKEPRKMLRKLFFGGICSTFMTGIITIPIVIINPSFLDVTQQTSTFKLFIDVFFCVALVEEFSKWFFVYIMAYNSEHFDQVYDIVVYAVFVALGFACLENILYVSQYGLKTGLFRAILAVPGHACDGVYMGYYLLLAKLCEIRNDQKGKKHNLYMSILVPVTLHGIYDFCAFSQTAIFGIVFIIFVVLLYVYTIKKILFVSKNNIRIRFRNNFCPMCGYKVVGNFCPVCGRRNE